MKLYSDENCDVVAANENEMLSANQTDSDKSPKLFFASSNAVPPTSLINGYNKKAAPGASRDFVQA